MNFPKNDGYKEEYPERDNNDEDVIMRITVNKGSDLSGVYEVQKADHFYEAYSGYGYIVMFFCGFEIKQLAGFPRNEMQKAIEFCRRKAKKSSEYNNHIRIKDSMQKKLQNGLKPVPYEDGPLYFEYKNKGYIEFERTSTYIWMQPPAKEKQRGIGEF